VTEDLVTVVLDSRCLFRASEKLVLEATLGRCCLGVIGVEANPVAQTTTVTYLRRPSGVVGRVADLCAALRLRLRWAVGARALV